MNFYDKIDKLCDLAGVSRKQMCNDIGLSYATLNSMIARQSKNITLTTIQNIARYFNVTLDYLMDDDIKAPLYVDNILSPPITTEPEKTIVEKFMELNENNKYRVEGIIDSYLLEEKAQREKKEKQDQQKPETILLKMPAYDGDTGIIEAPRDNFDKLALAAKADEIARREMAYALSLKEMEEEKQKKNKKRW